MNQLEGFISRFAGYGSVDAPLWFVGMEEGGGRDVQELERRVTAWVERGQQTFEDLAGFHHAIGQSAYFCPPYPLQRTWAALCRTLLAWRGAQADSASVKQIQAKVLGANQGQASLLELLPLPAANIDSWPYASLASEHPALESRDRYSKTYTSLREKMLHNLIESARPVAVIFYGQKCIESWSAIAHQPLRKVLIAGRACHVGPEQRPYFVAVPHPMTRGITSEFWRDVGIRIQQDVPCRQFGSECSG